MPYRRRLRRRGAPSQRFRKPSRYRSTTKRTRRPTRRSSGLPRSLNSTPFPATMYKALTYNSPPFSINTAVSGVCSNYVFRGNSLYDPDQTGTGGQPKFFDTFCGPADGTGNAPYGAYTVMASKITIDIYPDPTITSANNLFRVYCIPLRGGTASSNNPTNWVDVSERPYIRYKDFGSTGAQNKGRLKSYAKTKSLFSGMSVLDNDFQAGYASNPTNVWRWCIGIINMQNSGLPYAILSVKITYYCQFSNLNQVLSS